MAWLSVMDVGLAGVADHEGLASPLCHDPHPFRLFGRVEVGEVADLMHLHRAGSLADLAPSGQQPMDDLLATRRRWEWRAVHGDRVNLPPERDTAERRDQRSAVLAALNDSLEASA